MVESKDKTGVLFVCMGNICRSPTAEGAFRKVVEDSGFGASFDIDSAGTHAYHVNEPPDRRARAAALRRGIILDDIRARRIAERDFERFDYILAMDNDNLLALQEWSPEDHVSKISLFLEYSGSAARKDVPDPYYGGAAGFERVLDLVEEASEALLSRLKSQL